MTIALTRAPSPRIADCELTFLGRRAVDFERARLQHEEYVSALARHGVRVLEVDAAPDQPDGVFVEDCAVVVDELTCCSILLGESDRAQAPLAGA